MTGPAGRKDQQRSARERQAAEQAARAARAAQLRRTRRMFAIAGPLGVIALVVIVGLLVQSNRNSTSVDASAPRPKGVTGVGDGVAFGKASAPVIDLYEDFQCPSCKAFEDQTGGTLADLADKGKAKVVVHPLSFLDGRFGGKNSLRTAAAFGCAVDQGVGQDFHRVVFANQPDEGEGYTDQRLKEFGSYAGLKDAPLKAYEKCVTDKTYVGWATQVQATMERQQITATPTMFVDGKRFEYVTDGKLSPQFSTEGLMAAVAAATPATPPTSPEPTPAATTG